MQTLGLFRYSQVREPLLGYLVAAVQVFGFWIIIGFLFGFLFCFVIAICPDVLENVLWKERSWEAQALPYTDCIL